MNANDILLWHVSFERIERFVPQIPQIRAEGEDGTTPRICVSPSIERCVNAMPYGGYALKGLLNVAKTNRKMTPIVHAYAVVLNKNSHCLIPPRTLKEKYGVIDAVVTDEYWITEEVEFEHRIIEVYNAKFEMAKDMVGRDNCYVTGIDYDLMEQEPECTFETTVRKHGALDKVDIRKILKICSDTDKAQLVECWQQTR